VRTRTPAHEALRRVLREREHASGKLAALERFRQGVCDTPAEAKQQASGDAGRAPDGGVRQAPAALQGTEDRRDEVLELFDETVRPYTAEEAECEASLKEAVSEEFGRDVALLLSPERGDRLTQGLKDAVLSAAADRQSEMRAMEDALETEEESVGRAVDLADEVGASVHEIPLLRLGFDELREEYERLSALQERCEEGIEDRQEVLHRTTNHGAAAGVRHRDLVGYLYQDFPTDYPVLSTLTRLNEVCAERQRTVRSHLGRTA